MESTRAFDYIFGFLAVVFGIIVFLITIPVIFNWPFAVRVFSTLGIM